MAVRFIFSVLVVVMAMAIVLSGRLVTAAPNGLTYKGFSPNQPVCSGPCVPRQSNIPQRDCLKIYQCR
uniref:Bifunctional inhibitor/plant lipid transfer protein/seed storage helical domain-containing protein n=1 Tax=Leersia perrieri TaxID=77586 RepID=A0A0D9XRV1_9ORYZ